MSPFYTPKASPAKLTPGERWFRHGLELCREGRHHEALEPLQRAMGCVAEEPPAEYHRQVRSYYGMVLAVVRGDVGRGRILCAEAIADGPMDAELYVNLALVYIRCRRRPMAVEALQTALSIDPEHAGAQAQLDRLDRRRSPTIPFLSREHLLNKVAGQLRHRWLVRRNPTPR